MISPRSCIFAAIAVAHSALAQDLPTDLESAGIAATFPGYDSYTNASASYNLRFDYQPAGVVFPATTEQVSQAVSIAAANNVKVTAKSGGVSLSFHLLQCLTIGSHCRIALLHRQRSWRGRRCSRH